MANRPDPLSIHFGKRLQQIDAAHVVPDTLHGRAGIAVTVRIELVFAHVHVIRRHGHEAALGQVDGIIQSRRVTLAGDDALPQRPVGRMQAQDRGQLAGMVFGDEKEQRQTVAGFRGDRHFSADERADRHFLDNSRVEGDVLPLVGQRPHDLLHGREDLGRRVFPSRPGADAAMVPSASRNDKSGPRLAGVSSARIDGHATTITAAERAHRVTITWRTRLRLRLEFFGLGQRLVRA